MTDPDRQRRRLPSGPPVGGWGFGAAGIPAGFWGGLSLVLLVVAALLLASSYTGYGVIIGVLAVAAAVNLLP
ncbi:MAG: hypothetical protein EXQ74_03010 [Thermoleophilia bacterium]|nr:hypothetical protein [Thermoleophilia bacterium]